jgi:hypothetical protein
MPTLLKNEPNNNQRSLISRMSSPFFLKKVDRHILARKGRITKHYLRLVTVFLTAY